MTTTPQPTPSELAAMSNSSKPRPTYFFKRTGDGVILAVSEVDANELLRNRGQWMRNDFEYLGTSNGETYFKHVEDTKLKLSDKNARLKELQKGITRYVATQEKFMFEDLLDEQDAKLVKVKALIAEKQKEVDVLVKEIGSLLREQHQKAFDEELKKAKKNKQLPPNLNIITPNATDSRQREKIINEIPR